MAAYIGALDLGTTSNRFMLFDHQGQIAGVDQMEHAQIFPKPGWVEHDPLEIWENTQRVIKGALGKVDVSGNDLAAIGITNQRETTVVWDKMTGKPYYNAIVWQCTRTDEICHLLEKEGGQDRFRKKTGCRSPPILPARRSDGFWTMSPRHGRRRTGARPFSAPSKPGSSGSSPVDQPVVRM